MRRFVILATLQRGILPEPESVPEELLPAMNKQMEVDLYWDEHARMIRYRALKIERDPPIEEKPARKQARNVQIDRMMELATGRKTA